MSFFRNQFANVVEWEEFRDNMIFYKWSNREIKKGSRLIIRPGQDAIFLNNGKIEGIFRDDGEASRVAHAVFVAVRLHFDLEKILHGRDDNFFLVLVNLQVADHDGLDPEIGDVLFADINLHELDGALHVDHFTAENPVAADGEENPFVARGHMQHHGRLLAGTEGFLVQDDFQVAVAVAEFGGGVRCDPD